MNGAIPALGGTDTSRAWFDRARRSLAGGISSSARLTSTGPHPYPLYLREGSGARVRDVDGNEYIDHLISYGCAVLGHASPLLTTGTMFGTCTTEEVELAERIQAMVPCAELVRFVQGAVRAARGFTGRSLILKFEGHYHGWSNTLAVSNRPTPEQAGPAAAPRSVPHSPGIPPGVVDDVVVCPWNDPDALRTVLAAHRGRLAAVICEPIVANNACTMPAPGCLELLRELCTAYGVPLIFDEVCTGFRTGPGGAQGLYQVVPDLAVFAKALGGGVPIAAFAGRRALMEPLAEGRVKHGGTYNASPLCATAALTTLRALPSRPPPGGWRRRAAGSWRPCGGPPMTGACRAPCRGSARCSRWCSLRTVRRPGTTGSCWPPTGAATTCSGTSCCGAGCTSTRTGRRAGSWRRR
ncbi:hypothetical protein GCM10009757_02910 [Streptomyces cheonanensis]|uniref:Glutamate-1-semialdehyde 2,1-aminomutase n=1 Tax=Streptomyces cheonanensis TaxID=312720 RepID=A0ABP5G7E5_9ACTN|nr:aminotransferase class III-fold pyridoxal phosphate-dependent enzyme [Streptomyces harbinensis]